MDDRQWNTLVSAIHGEPLSPLPVGFIIDSPWLPNWAGCSILDYFTDERVFLNANLKAIRSFPQVLFTREEYGPVHVIAWWEIGYEEPIYLVTNVEKAHPACTYYRKRFRIETFFSDQKSRGFHLHKSHISDPQRLARLMIAACFAYIWIIYLGVICLQDGWKNQIHRTDRCDLSLFQLGLDLLEYFLNENLPILVDFRLPVTSPP